MRFIQHKLLHHIAGNSVIRQTECALLYGQEHNAQIAIMADRTDLTPFIAKLLSIPCPNWFQIREVCAAVPEQLQDLPDRSQLTLALCAGRRTAIHSGGASALGPMLFCKSLAHFLFPLNFPQFFGYTGC